MVQNPFEMEEYIIMNYGLIGEKLGHSYSKDIHEMLADYTYDLCPLSRDEFKSFMSEHAFKAINVTIPYKQDVIPYLDEIDDNAKSIGAVNTIVNKDGKLCGHNTDFSGFMYMLKKHNSEFKEVKQKGEIIETYWKVTLTKVFDDMKEPTGSTTIEYNTNGESAY